MSYGLVLAGGGTRGGYQVGVWKALMEMNIDISVITGTSIGAINGALFAQGSFEVANKLWEKIAIDDVLALPDEISDASNLFSIKNLACIVKEIYKNDGLDTAPLENILKDIIDEDKIRNSPIDFGIVTYSLTNKKEIEIFKENIPGGKMIQFLMASACFPGFKFKKIGNQTFVDGGVRDNMPIDMMLTKEVDDIITIDVRGVGVLKSVSTAGKNIISIKSEEPAVGIMDFDRSKIKVSINEGYYDCLRAFGKVAGERYCFEVADYYHAKGKYGESLLSGLEKAADVLEINRLYIYTVDELIEKVVQEYNGDNDFSIKKIVNMLDGNINDFIKSKLGVLGSSYDAANTILYFKRKFEEKQ